MHCGGPSDGQPGRIGRKQAEGSEQQAMEKAAVKRKEGKLLPIGYLKKLRPMSIQLALLCVKISLACSPCLPGVMSALSELVFHFILIKF